MEGDISFKNGFGKRPMNEFGYNYKGMLTVVKTKEGERRDGKRGTRLNCGA
jgi:hypothetical protein